MKKKYYILIGICGLILLASIGATYAFFSFIIEGSGSKFTVTTGELRLIYTDTMAIGEGSISPGFSVTKTFTVENTTDSEVYYKLSWENLVNTFVNTSDLTITVTSTNNGGTLSKTSIPSSSIESNVDIIEEIAIGGNTIQEYTLTIEYADAEYDQSEDMGKQLSGTIEIDVIESISRTVIVRSNNESYGTVSPGEAEVENKGSATFTLNANEGYKYISNTCNGTVEGNTLTIENIESDITCEVEFGIKEYTVTASVNDNTYASIDSPTSVVVSHGESTTFNYNVTEGYEYESVEGCTGEYDTGTNILTVSNVTENQTCIVNFKIKEYNVSISGVNGTVTPEVAVVEHGGSTTFEASTEEAYDISSGNLVCNNGASGSIIGNTITVNNITNDTVCTITFSKKQYTISASSKGNGEVNPTTNTVNYGENATITLTPATGYEYSSNTCGAAYSNNTLTLTNVTSNKTCEVEFKIKTYSVSVTSNNTNYGTITQSASTVNHGESVTVTLSPKTGYEYVSNTCGGTVSGSTLTISNITEAKTCQVVFAIKTYSVSVTSTNTSYGTVNPTTTTINHGSNASITLSPNAGYQYSSNTCGGTVSGNTMTISNVTAAKTCTVTFSPITYSITYNLNSGTQGSNAVTSYNVTTSTFSLPTPTRTGYTFGGWYTTSTFTGSAVTQIAKGSTGNKTYYAKWTANTNTAYKVQHWQQTLTGADTENSTNYTLKETDNLTGTTDTSVTPSRKTYTGFTSPSGKSVTISGDGSTVVNYYYKRNSYTYTLGSGTGVSTSGSTASGTYKYGATITLKATASTGYTFSKWTSSSTSLVSDKTTANTTFTMPAGNITMTPSATLNSYAVNVSSNGNGTVNPTTTTINHGSNASITLSPNAGYQYSSNTCGGTVSGNTMAISNVTAAKTCTVTFSPITYSITYNLNSGTQGSNAVTSYNVTTSTFSLPTPTRTGYTFNGWYTTSTFTGSAVTQITKGSTGNKTYYAKWTLNTYNVNVTSTNNSYGIVSPTSQVVNHGSSAEITLSPATDYKYSSNTCGGTVSGNTMTISNITAAKTCTVTFELISYVAGAGEGTLTAQIANDNLNVKTRTSFNTIFTESNNGNTIYSATGEGGATTYYFAGNVTNNYVKFGTNSSGAELWWRIVRINEDNSVRLIYAGTSATDTAGFISTSQAFNSTLNASYYEGYEYAANQQHGTGTNSDIKGVVDTWYTNNLADEASYLSQTAIYCNDRTVSTGSWVATGSAFYYDAYYRLNSTPANYKPVFTCTNASDKFTVSNTTGNGALENPIALITADEVGVSVCSQPLQL